MCRKANVLYISLICTLLLLAYVLSSKEESAILYLISRDEPKGVPGGEGRTAQKSTPDEISSVEIPQFGASTRAVEASQTVSDSKANGQKNQGDAVLRANIESEEIIRSYASESVDTAEDGWQQDDGLEDREGDDVERQGSELDKSLAKESVLSKSTVPGIAEVAMENESRDEDTPSTEVLDEANDDKAAQEEKEEELALRLRSEIGSPGFVNRTFGRVQDEDVYDVLAEMAKCRSLQCAIKAEDKLAGRTRFNFPHFFLIGWQKCATTSVNAYLRHHPQYLPGLMKEPHHFTVCQNRLDAPHCQSKNESHYLRAFLRIDEATASRLEQATADASADYAQAGAPLARRLYRLFPWLKIVIMMREPISRLISYTRMHTEQTYQPWKACPAGATLFKCLYPKLRPGQITSNYSEPLEGWLSIFPTNQIHVIQFEELQSDPEKVLFDLKMFLGMDVDLPTTQIFQNINARKGEGYPIRRGQYTRLVRWVRWDADRVADLLDRYGLADREAWIRRWENVWDEMLTRCDQETEECMVDSN